MVRNIQAVFENSMSLLGKLLFPSVVIILIVMAVVAVLSLVLYRINRDAFESAAKILKMCLNRFGVILLIFVIFLLEVSFLKAIRQGVINRINQASAARYTTDGDSGYCETKQYAPTVTYNNREIKTQKLIIPKYTLNFLSAGNLKDGEGVNAVPGWAPEELRYDTRPIVNVEDQLERDDNAIVINRKTTIDSFLPLKLMNTDIFLKLNFRDQGNKAKRQFYQADFMGRYRFVNPFSERKMIHFSFPFPSNSGTLSNFRLLIDAKEYLVQDVRNGYEWTGEVDGKKQVNIEVDYSHSGSRSWTYNLSSRCEAIKDFKLVVESNNPFIKFQKGALPPTKRSKSLAGTTLIWELKNLITTQDISLFFPSISKSELITRLYLFSPLALAGFVLMLVSWAFLYKLELKPVEIVLASLAYSGGFAMSGYLLTYLPLSPAMFLSFSICMFINMMILKHWSFSELMPVLVLFFVVPLTFLFVGNTGILLCIAGMIIIGLFSFRLMTKK